MKKVLIIHKNTIEKEPPTQMVIQHLLDLGINVKLVTLGTNDYWQNYLNSKGVEYVDIGLSSFVNSPKRTLLMKLKAWLKYRSSVLNIISSSNHRDSIIWFVDADSIAPLLFSSVLNKLSFVMHILEMYDHSLFYKYIIKKYVSLAKRLIVCEENRAAIFNVWFSPKNYPVVLPNKPYKLLDNSSSLQYLRENHFNLYEKLVTNRCKVILYQGLISPERDLTYILQAINELNEEFVPIIMGKDYGMIDKYKKICPRIVHISYIPSPQHLYITSIARLGILMYDPISLNQIFCAPNKIFEYAGYGVPMIGNNIPGLSIPFQKFGCGKVFNINDDKNEIKKIILEIDKNYNQFSENASILYNSIDNRKIIKSLLSEF